MADSTLSCNLHLPDDTPSKIVARLTAACHSLLDRADEIDRAAMGSACEMPLLLFLADNKVGIVIRREANKRPELICHLDTLVAEHRNVSAVGIDRAGPCAVDHFRDRGRLAIGQRLQVLDECVAGSPKRSAVSDQRCEVVTETVWKRVNSALGFLSPRKQWPSTLLQCLFDVADIEGSAYLSRNVKGQATTSNVDRVETLGQIANLVQQKPANNSGICLAQVDCLIVLLLRNLSGFVRNLSSSLGGSVRKHRNPHRCCGASDTHHYGDGSDQSSPYSYGYSCPVGHGSHADRWKTERNRHNPSVLEPILP
ncbi:hypothetical protein [Stenotrophomonas sp.]|uniref:hypothetical protein n=1 Tax=Stenotrophomonas sp. TaxID=69392 RepID=UPI00289FC1C2|nr:hypothetical protein [Stenotrophomonas sp.]